MTYWIILLVTTTMAFVGTGMLCRYARLNDLLDMPNERSSHKVATPRGGGAAIVLATFFGFCALWWLEAISLGFLMALVGGGVAVAVVGFVDDRYRLPVWVRLVVHSGAALWGLLWLGGFPAIQIGETVIELGWIGYVIGMIGIVWVLNLYNFMDGIDGIATMEAIFIVSTGTILANSMMPFDAMTMPSLVLGAACLGFLFWNWPPAKIFMGDVGSGYLGYVIAIMALAATHQNPAGFWVWLILGGVFFVDATVTLARRLARGERIYEAHRSHAYQWLARHWKSHRRVTLLVLVINLVWLLPCAWLAHGFPTQAGWISAAALFPIVILVLTVSSGRFEPFEPQ